MSDPRRIVVDVLKPHDPSLVAFTQHVADAASVASASATLLEHDKEVQNVEITVDGESLDYGAVEAAIEDLGGTVHSIDHVACGEESPSERPAGERR
jgi:hypothetical protein